MLNFNHSGLLVPDALIKSTLHELENEFVDKIQTEKRKELFDNYVKYSNDLKEVFNLKELQQWINGSYVTQKRNPGDIDLVTFIDYDVIKRLGDTVNKFIFPASESIYGVDAYIIEVYPQDHKDYFKYRADYAHWYEIFTRTRRIRGNKLAKGFLEIFI
ncbi:DUF6932 family protein [Flavobacterium sp. FlaQc-48]|uniref:DUF6932 family protein n=1 Tax=Flavobacterium sp. FlaQc-48 TaxID=3374181 RepID=UPI003757DC5D